MVASCITQSAEPSQTANTTAQKPETADPARLTSTGHSFASFLLGAVDQGAATATPGWRTMTAAEQLTRS